MSNKKTGCSSCAARKAKMLKQHAATTKQTIRTKIANFDNKKTNGTK